MSIDVVVQSLQKLKVLVYSQFDPEKLDQIKKSLKFLRRNIFELDKYKGLSKDLINQLRKNEQLMTLDQTFNHHDFLATQVENRDSDAVESNDDKIIYEDPQGENDVSEKISSRVKMAASSQTQSDKK